MTYLESALRGGAVTLLVLLAILLIRDGHRVLTARLGACFAVGVAAYIVVSASAFIEQAPLWSLPLRILGAGNPVVFWLLAATSFDDEFAPSRRHFAIWLAMSAFGIVCFFVGALLVHFVAMALSLTCNVIALRYAVVGRSEDLVEGRRKLRMIFIAAAALYSIAQISAEFLVTQSASRTLLESINAVGLIAITFVFCLDLLSVNRQSSVVSLTLPKRPALQSAKKAEVSLEPALDAAAQQDAAWLLSLRRVMETDKIYREEALSVATLSDKLGMPDYRLRRLINRELGYRNFTAFLNDHRLADVTAALSDPAQAGIPILTIALSAGFQSIGPFNRAFKAHAGATPTEFRQEQLAKAERRSAA
jgi:AraC-like DNA-binding protein